MFHFECQLHATGPARMQRRGPAEVPSGLTRRRCRNPLVICAMGVSRAPVSGGHTYIATPGVRPRKEKDNSGVDGLFVVPQNLSSLLHVCCMPAPSHSQRSSGKETTVSGGLSQGDRWAALQISYCPPPLQGTREQIGVVPHRAVSLGTVAGSIMRHLPLESTYFSFSTNRDFFFPKIFVFFL